MTFFQNDPNLREAGFKAINSSYGWQSASTKNNFQITTCSLFDISWFLCHNGEHSYFQGCFIHNPISMENLIRRVKLLISYNCYSAIQLFFRHWNITSIIVGIDWMTLNCFFTIQSVSSMNINSPIMKLLVSINRSFPCYLMLSKCQILCLQIFW